jgi:hypothetical protein
MGHKLVALARGPLGKPEPDILGNRVPGKQPRLLENDADRRVRLDDRFGIEPDGTVARAVEARRSAGAPSSFPQPDPPIRATISPARTCSETLESAVVPSA